MSYYNPKIDHFKYAFHTSLYNRASLYLQQNKPALARKDVVFFLGQCPEDPYFKELLEQIDEELKN